MSRKPINWLVEKEDIKEFIKPIDIEIPIDKGQYGYIFNNNKIKNAFPANYFKYLENEMVDRLYINDGYEKYKRLLKSKISLSYIPDFKNNNWYIGYSPIQIVNALFKTLDINVNLDFIDYNDKSRINRIKNGIMLILIEEQLKTAKEKGKDDKFRFIDDSIKAVDNIFLFAGYDVETRMEDSLIYKNLLYYLSVKSLDILDETDDILYSYIPRQYYMEVTTKDKAQWPSNLTMDYNRVYSYNFSNYNKRFESVMLRYPCIFEEILGIDEIGVMERLEILKNDIFLDDIESNYSKYKKKKNYTKTDEELSIMLKSKIDFYKELLSMKDENGNNIVVSPIKGRNDLYGYYGFVLNNNYIVLDKFYNMSKKDDTMKPAADEAIYSMPLDLFVELKGSKRQMMKYIKENPKGNVKRNYHTKKHSYKDRILEVTKKENVSSMNSDWFLSIYSPKKLVLNNK